MTQPSTFYSLVRGQFVWTVLVNQPPAQMSKRFLVTFFQKSNRFLRRRIYGAVQHRILLKSSNKAI
jgi:hypothetical protein